jgi:hypothetical protein
VALRDELAAVATWVSAAREEPYSAHPLAQRITGAWKETAAEVVGDLGYLVVGSAGKGNWARTVWLAFFDRMVTESAQRGFYIVYLISGDGSRIYLSLNQRHHRDT